MDEINEINQKLLGDEREKLLAIEKFVCESYGVAVIAASQSMAKRDFVGQHTMLMLAGSLWDCLWSDHFIERVDAYRKLGDLAKIDDQDVLAASDLLGGTIMDHVRAVQKDLYSKWGRDYVMKLNQLGMGLKESGLLNSSTQRTYERRKFDLLLAGCHFFVAAKRYGVGVKEVLGCLVDRDVPHDEAAKKSKTFVRHIASGDEVSFVLEIDLDSTLFGVDECKRRLIEQRALVIHGLSRVFDKATTQEAGFWNDCLQQYNKFMDSI